MLFQVIGALSGVVCDNILAVSFIYFKKPCGISNEVPKTPHDYLLCFFFNDQ
jgi:hypothetical protein